jgi:TonB-dependent SusC/RagA subfamily outer membrane receptor
VALAAAAASALPGLPGAPREAGAQQTPAGQGVVAGVVVSEGAPRPLADAQVSVEGTTLGAATDAAGRFRIANVSGTEVRLTVRRIGFRPTTITARVGETDLRVVLGERALALSQVVVTGTAGVAERRAVGNAVSNVNAAEVTATQPVRNFQDLLTGRAAGVSVVGSSGQVGSGSRIRVRGASSLSLQNDPLIYVDGIRVDNAQASGPTNQGFGSQSVSRWNDFDPDDIESLEIIKGPAAATLYGTEASNGVIQIITKKGAAGRATWNLTTRQGANYFNDWQDRLFVNYGAIPRPGGGSARDTVTISPRQLNDSLRANFGEDIFRTGRLQDYQLNLSGGSTAFRYYVGGGYEENQGVERVNGLRRSNLRANVQATPGQTYDLQASLGYTTGRTNIPREAGGGGATWGTYFSSPTFLQAGGNPVQLGFRSGPPDVYYQAYRIFQDADRFTGSVQLAHRPFGWLNHRLIVGVDRLMEDNQEIVPRNDVLGSRYASFAFTGGSAGGYLAIGTRDATNSTFDYVANATLGLGRSLKSVTSVGGQYYGRRTIFRNFYGENFPAAGLVALNAAAVQRLERDDIIENNTSAASCRSS